MYKLTYHIKIALILVSVFIEWLTYSYYICKNEYITLQLI
jgi:hypothetical protein